MRKLNVFAVIASFLVLTSSAVAATNSSVQHPRQFLATTIANRTGVDLSYSVQCISTHAVSARQPTDVWMQYHLGPNQSEVAQCYGATMVIAYRSSWRDGCGPSDERAMIDSPLAAAREFVATRCGMNLINGSRADLADTVKRPG